MISKGFMYMAVLWICTTQILTLRAQAVPLLASNLQRNMEVFLSWIPCETTSDNCYVPLHATLLRYIGENIVPHVELGGLGAPTQGLYTWHRCVILMIHDNSTCLCFWILHDMLTWVLLLLLTSYFLLSHWLPGGGPCYRETFYTLGSLPLHNMIVSHISCFQTIWLKECWIRVAIHKGVWRIVVQQNGNTSGLFVGLCMPWVCKKQMWVLCNVTILLGSSIRHSLLLPASCPCNHLLMIKGI